MKSRISFFDITVLKKDITRFAPIWSIYTIFLLLYAFGVLGMTHAAIRADNVLESMQAMTVINLIYAGIVGAFLFMDLYNGRLCNALHAFPLRRESWLLTHTLSGILFSLVPNLLVCALGSFMLGKYVYIAPIWLAVSTLQYLFFFGTAALCAMCAGNLIGMAALYGIFHFITVLVYAVADLLYQPLLHGVRLYNKDFYRFFPTEEMTVFDYVKFNVKYTDMDAYGTFQGLEGDAWLYLGLCAAVGLVSIALAWLVYRRRHLESAGDLISLRKLSGLFTLICTIGAGIFLYLFSEVFGNDRSYFFLFLGMVIGYFAGQMLLNRTVKVFTKKSFLRLGILIVALAGSLLVTRLDPLGVTRYIPKLDNIQSAQIVGADKGLYYTESFSLFYREDADVSGYAITDPEALADLRDFHSQMIQYRPAENDGTQCQVNILYTLKDGRTVKRYYKVGRNTALGERAGKYFSDMRYLFEVQNTDSLYGAFESVTLDIFTGEKNTSKKLIQEAEISGLLDAIQADCEAGVMAQNWAYHEYNDKEIYDIKYKNTCYIEFSVKDSVFDRSGWDTSRFHLQVWPDCTNTMAYIETMMADDSQ